MSHNDSNKNQSDFTELSDNVNDKANVGLVILSIIIPIAGLILYFSKKKHSYKSSKIYGIAALFSIIVGVVISLVISIYSQGDIPKLTDKVIGIKKAESYTQELENNYTANEGAVNTTEDTDNKITSTQNIEKPEIKMPNADWTRFEVNINSTVVVLPMKYSEFAKQTGFSWFEQGDNNRILKSSYTVSKSLVNNSKTRIIVSLINFEKEDTKYEDC